MADRKIREGVPGGAIAGTVQFVLPLGFALFLVTMVFLYDAQPGLLRLEVAGIFLLAITGGWTLCRWMQGRK